MGDGYIDTDGTDLVYGLLNHSRLPMGDCYAISHRFVYIITLKYTYIYIYIYIYIYHLH